MASTQLIYDKEYWNTRQLSFQLFQGVNKVLQGNRENAIELIFDFSNAQFHFPLKLVELFQDLMLHYDNNRFIINKSRALILVKNLDRKNKQSCPSLYLDKLEFRFDKTIFYESADFTNLWCHQISFEETVFHKDAKFAFVDVEEFIYKPYQLDVDVTFYHREKANMAEGKLRGVKNEGCIGTFTFRHHLSGSGKTYFVGVNFKKKAFFQDVNLENVVFSYIDSTSMSNCYFANSFIENTQFYKCEFDYNPNRIALFAFSKQYLYVAIPIVCCLLWGIIYLLNSIDNYPYMYISLPIIIFANIFLTLMSLNLVYMSLMYYVQKASLWLQENFWSFFEIFGSLNHHICVADDDIKHEDIEQQKENFQSLREVYRQLRINHEKHGDWQLAGEFYYSQRYCEVISQMNFFKGQLQHMLLNVHHVVNGFGERWLRALVWVCVTLGIFALFGGEPNRDYVSTKSTPEYLLVAHKPMSNKNASDYNRTHYQEFDESNVTDNNVSKQAHFMLYSKTSYIKEDDNIVFPQKVFAYDDRFNYHYNEQYIPMLKNSFEVKLLHSLSKFVSPFTSSEKQWFQDRSEKAYFRGFAETLFLWLFFGGFILAVKNKIKR